MLPSSSYWWRSDSDDNYYIAPIEKTMAGTKKQTKITPVGKH